MDCMEKRRRKIMNLCNGLCNDCRNLIKVIDSNNYRM